ncbi:MAG: DUF99 family protein [archaeon]|nr:DUF99 family protein [archaeon]
MLKEIKDGIQTVGIDDSIHNRGDLYTELFFIFCRGTFIENIVHKRVEVDGLDSTKVILEVLKPLKEQFRLITLHGITVGGFNLVDIEKIFNSLDKPIIAVTENKPEGNSMYEALKNLPQYEMRKKIFDKAGPIHSIQTQVGKNELFYHLKGIENSLAIKFLNKFAVRSRLPEQLLLAHKIASAW